MIIGICGLIGSGKDTVAQTLIDNHNFVKTSFADRLKDVIEIPLKEKNGVATWTSQWK